MAHITIVAVLVVAAVICFYFSWSSKTYRMINDAIVRVYDSEDYDYVSESNDSVIVTNIKNYLRSIRSMDDVSDDVVLDAPRKSNHLFAEATNGEWSKLYRSHYGKGVTLHTYRTKRFSKRVLNPCMCGGHPECFS